jgi:FAD:protein FMN transferase
MFGSFDFQEFLSAFIVLFAVIDIIGSIPIILNLKQKGRNVNANKATGISFALLIGFFYAGDMMLKLFQVDITVAPLVNAWGFGFKKSTGVDSLIVDSLRQMIGYQKIDLQNNRIMKKDPRIMLDCSAIAKGFGVDAVARLLERKGIKNYMVDIGGEVVVRGKNSKMNAWRIGINKPVDDSLSVNQELQTVLAISDVGMATSGNYRNFYYKGGKKYAHTIDPRTGYPVQHSILSSTVIAKDCASADAYATAFMVMGLDSAKAFCEAHPELDAYFICSGEGDKYETYFTDGMKKFIINEK